MTFPMKLRVAPPHKLHRRPTIARTYVEKAVLLSQTFPEPPHHDFDSLHYPTSIRQSQTFSDSTALEYRLQSGLGWPGKSPTRVGTLTPCFPQEHRASMRLLWY